MARSETKEEIEVAAAKPAKQTDFDMTIEEFCTRLSQTDKRVELIGAFHAAEINGGHRKDREAAFKTRLVAFAQQPA